MSLKVNEIFGPTIQGEGFAAGRHCLFVRLRDCNLECTWCDTAYTWAFTDAKAAKTQSGVKYDKATNGKEMSHLEVLDELNELWPIDEEPTIIVISGGEPMMQQEELILLVNNLRAMQHEVHIETAGTIAPTQEMLELVTQFNVSPKLGSSGNVLTKRYKPEVLRTLVACNGTYYSARAYFKFVVVSLNDFTEIDHIVTNLDIPLNRIQVMPEGTTSLGQIKHGREIVDAALVRGYGLSFRTHTLLWGNERGK